MYDSQECGVSNNAKTRDLAKSENELWGGCFREGFSFYSASIILFSMNAPYKP
jgi:hypothetical protein